MGYVAEYAQLLVDRASEYMSRGDYMQAYLDCLDHDYHDHTGWTRRIQQLFDDPQNKEEQDLSNQLAEIISETAFEFLQVTQPSTEFDQVLNAGIIVTLVIRLGDRASLLLLVQTEQLLASCVALGVDHGTDLALERVRELLKEKQ